MNNEKIQDTEIQELKTHLGEYLRIYKGIDTSKNFKCISGTHQDKTPSMSYKNDYVKCFSCNKTYDLFDLIGIDYNLTNFTDKIKKAMELFNTGDYKPINKKIDTNNKGVATPGESEQLEINKNIILQAQKEIDNYDYFENRGISKDIINKFKLGYHKDDFSNIYALIPTSDNSYTARNIDNNNNNYRYKKSKGKTDIFNINTIKKNKIIAIVEGEFDSLTLESLGIPAIALGSTANIKKLIEHLKNKKINNTFILLLDNDSAGGKAQGELRKEFDSLKIKYIAPVGFYPDNIKDFNEYYLNNSTEASDKINEIMENVKSNKFDDMEISEAHQELINFRNKYLENDTKNYIQEFISGVKTTADTPAIPTGFKKLDEYLDGGLYEGLYIIGAISSLGKTTFTLQIADNIAQQGEDILFFSIEMSKFELMAKSFSRLTYVNTGFDEDLAKTTRGITTGARYKYYSDKENNVIKKAMEDYQRFKGRIIINEADTEDININFIKKNIETHLKITGKKPIVIIDYLQIIEPINERLTDKQNTDKAVKELKRLSRRYKIPIIAISSLNRDSYGKNISMKSFKESGGIEYSSDILIGIDTREEIKSEEDINKIKSRDPRELKAVILKNRNGNTGDSINFNYKQKYNHFAEV